MIGVSLLTPRRGLHGARARQRPRARARGIASPPVDHERDQVEVIEPAGHQLSQGGLGRGDERARHAAPAAGSPDLPTAQGHRPGLIAVPVPRPVNIVLAFRAALAAQHPRRTWRPLPVGQCPRAGASRASFADSAISAIDTITCSGTATSPGNGSAWPPPLPLRSVLLTSSPLLS